MASYCLSCHTNYNWKNYDRNNKRYDTVVWLSDVSKYKHHQSHFNLRKFLFGFFILRNQLDPNFLLLCISFLLCMDLQPYSNDCFSKISRTLFYFLNNTYWVSFFQRNNSLIFRTGVSCFSVTLFYSALLALTDGQKDGQRNECTCFAWAGGTFFPVVLLCCVSFWFWWEIGFGLHTHVLRVQYRCGGVLVFWFWQEIVFGVTYIHTQYTIQLCCCVSCWLQQ